MAGDDARLQRRQVALDDVQVGAADSAGEDAEQDMAGGDGGSGDVLNADEVTGCGEGGIEDSGRMGLRLVR